MPLDFPNVPFSVPLSYLAIGHHAPDDWGRRHPGGLLLRMVRTSARSPFVARMIPLTPDGSTLRFTRFDMQPEVLRAGTPAGNFEFAFADPDTVLVRADRPGIGLRLDFLPEGPSIFDAVLSVPAPGAPGGTALLVNSFKNGTRFLLAPRVGLLDAGESGWDGRDSARVTVDLRPGAANADAPVEFSLRECVGEWDGTVPGEAFADAASDRADRFAFTSPVQTVVFDSVTRLAVEPAIEVGGDTVRVTVAVPWALLGMEPPARGATLRGDAGIILSDAQGTANAARVYRSNRHTGLVNDQPGEAVLQPAGWSDAVFE